jgi:hypothetical protein
MLQQQKSHKCNSNMVSLRNWIENKNKTCGCDLLATLHSILLFQNPRSSHYTASTLFSKWPHYTFTLKSPKLSKMMVTTTIVPKILHLFIISLVLVLKMQTLDVLIPSWHFWHNGKLDTMFKKSKIHRYFRPQLSTIQIQTNATFPNEQN